MSFLIPRSRNEQPPEEPVDENTPFTTRFGFAAAFIGTVIVGTMAWSTLNSRVDAAEKERVVMNKAHAETDERVKALEKANADMALAMATVRNDVAWMRKQMEEHRRRGAP